MAFRRSVLAAVCAAACSGNGAPAPIQIEQLRAAYVAARCAEAMRCGLVDDLGKCATIPAYEVRVGLVVDDNLIAAVEGGRVEYLPESAAACLAAMTASCTQAEFGTADSIACDHVFVGVGSGGDPCKLNSECLSGFCSVFCTPDACCEGSCELGVAPERLAPGEVCANNQSACADSYCDATTGVCTPYKTAGGGCTQSSMCEPGTTCSPTTLACVGPPARGQRCSPAGSGPCRDVGDRCSADGTCEPVGLTGAPCADNHDCSPYYLCDASHHCAFGPRRGEPCSGGCVDDSTCDPVSAICVAPLPDGAACSYDAQCASGHCDTTVAPAVCADKLPVCF